MTSNFTERLFNQNEITQVNNQRDCTFEQYKLYIESAEKISDRRQKTNEFFLGINTALVTGIGFLITQVKDKDISLLLFLACFLGGTIAYLWYRILKSYKGINSGKFKVIHLVEKRLPLSLYETEWEILEKGKNKDNYWPFSHIELIVPKIFIVTYFLLFILNIDFNSSIQIINCLQVKCYSNL